MTLLLRKNRLLLKANRKPASGGRVTNGELVTVKSVRAEGGIELSDGRVLDSALSGKQRSLIPDGQPVVLEIIVTEIKDGDKQHLQEVKE